MGNGTVEKSKQLVRWLLSKGGLGIHKIKTKPFPEASLEEIALINRVLAYTMTSSVRCWTMLKALQYISRSSIQGDIVECGVWRGGLVMLSKLVTQHDGLGRRFFLYDTFAGMTAPTAVDTAFDGTPTRPTFLKFQRETHNEW